MQNPSSVSTDLWSVRHTGRSADKNKQKEAAQAYDCLAV